MCSSPFLPTGSKMDGAKEGVFCPGMREGSWTPSLLGAPSERGFSGSGNMGSSEFNTVVIN